MIYNRTTKPLSSTVVTTSPVKLKSTALKGAAFASPPALVDGFLIEVMKPPATSGSLVQIVPKELLKVVCEVILAENSIIKIAASRCALVDSLPQC